MTRLLARLLYLLAGLVGRLPWSWLMRIGDAIGEAFLKLVRADSRQADGIDRFSQIRAQGRPYMSGASKGNTFPATTGVARPSIG